MADDLIYTNPYTVSVEGNKNPYNNTNRPWRATFIPKDNFIKHSDDTKSGFRKYVEDKKIGNIRRAEVRIADEEDLMQTNPLDQGIGSAPDDEDRYNKPRRSVVAIDSRDRNRDLYPDQNHYKIHMNRQFRNVKSIRLISTEIPNTEQAIKDSPPVLANNKIYWLNDEDASEGLYPYECLIYQGDMVAGNYTANTIVSHIRDVTDDILRFSDRLPHEFLIDINIDADIFGMTQIKRTTLMLNPFTTTRGSNVITISSPGHTFAVGDQVIFTGSSRTAGINSTILNSTHVIISVTTDTYDIIVNAIADADTTGGGSSVVQGQSKSFKLLFSNIDTPGEILGFPQQDTSFYISYEISSVNTTPENLAILPSPDSVLFSAGEAPSWIISENHKLKVGDKITITGMNTIPDINGDRTVTEVIDNNTFEIGVKVCLVNNQNVFTSRNLGTVIQVIDNGFTNITNIRNATDSFLTAAAHGLSSTDLIYLAYTNTTPDINTVVTVGNIIDSANFKLTTSILTATVTGNERFIRPSGTTIRPITAIEAAHQGKITATAFSPAPGFFYVYNTDTSPTINSSIAGINLPILYNTSSGIFESSIEFTSVISEPSSQSLIPTTSDVILNIRSITAAFNSVVETTIAHNLPVVSPPNAFLENTSTDPNIEKLIISIASVPTSTTFTLSVSTSVGFTQEVTDITAVADVGGSLNNTYFEIDTPNNQYYVWYNVAAGGTDPAVAGRIGIEVAIATNDTASTVASATATAMDLSPDFSVPAPGGSVFTVTNSLGGTVTDATDAGTTGFGIAVTTQGEGTVTSVQEVTDITTVADVSGSLNDTYFYLNSTTTEYYVWYNVAAAGTDPVISGKTGIQVAIATNDTALTVATSTVSAILGATADFRIPTPGTSTFTVTNVLGGYVENPSDVGLTGFTLSVTTQGTGPVVVFTLSNVSGTISSVRPKTNGTFTTASHGLPPSTTAIFIANLQNASPSIALPLFGDVVQASRYNGNLNVFETNVVIPGASNTVFALSGNEEWILSDDAAVTLVSDVVRATDMTIEYSPALVPALAADNNVLMIMNVPTSQDLNGVSAVSFVDTGPNSFEVSGKTIVSVGMNGELTVFTISNTVLGVGTATFTIINHPYTTGDQIEILTHSEAGLLGIRTITATTSSTVTISYGGALGGVLGTVRKLVVLDITNTIVDVLGGDTVLTVLNHPFSIGDIVEIVTHDEAGLVGDWTIVDADTATIHIPSIIAVAGITGTMRYKYLGKFIRTVNSFQPKVINDIEIGSDPVNITATDHLIIDAISPIRVFIQGTDTTPNINGLLTISLPAIIVSSDVFQLNELITAVNNKSIIVSIDKGRWSRKPLITNVGVPTITSSSGGVTTVETIERANPESTVMFPISISLAGTPPTILASGHTFSNGDVVHISGHKYSTPLIKGNFLIDNVIPDTVVGLVSSSSPGPTITVTTSVAHGFSTDTYVRFSGHSTYLDNNGPFLIISVPSLTTFVINIPISTYSGGGAIGTVSGGASFTIPITLNVAGTAGFVTGPSEPIPGHSLMSFTSSDIGAGITGIAIGNPTVITTASAHLLISGYTITISGTDCIPNIDGIRTVTVLSSTTFSLDLEIYSPGTSGSWVYNDFVSFDSLNSEPNINGIQFPITKISDTQFSIPYSLTSWRNLPTARWGSNIITVFYVDHGLVDNDLVFMYNAERVGGNILPSDYNTSHGPKRMNIPTNEELTSRHFVTKIDNDTFTTFARAFPNVRERGGGFFVCISSHNHTNEEKALGLKNHGFDFVHDNRNCNGLLNRVISLEGEPYIFLKSPALDTLTTTNLQENVFAKILLSDPPGSLLYNTFVSNAKVYDDPITVLDSIEVSFIREDGRLFNFNGIDHSFSLEIFEYIDRLKKANVSSRRGVVDRGAISQLGEYERGAVRGAPTRNSDPTRSTFTYTDVAREDNPTEYLDIRRGQQNRTAPDSELGDRTSLNETSFTTRGRRN